MAGKSRGEGQSTAAKMDVAARHLAERGIGAPVAPQRLRAMIFALTGALPPDKLEEMDNARLRAIALAFRRALARERGKARSGHRSYDANRHIALHQALRGLQALASGAAQTPL